MSKGENTLINWLRTRFAADPAEIPLGIGDDAAVVRVKGGQIAVTADMLLDGVHFDRRQHSYAQIGRKAIACSLSDCAAMACRPTAMTVSLALPADMNMDDVKKLYEGMAGLAEQFNCPIVGGDTTSWPGGLAIDVAILAEPMSDRGPVLRSGARSGDLLFVSGKLGGSLAGRHMNFMPRLELAEKLVQQSGLHGLMDLSDGLSMDLHRLCDASGCAAELDVENIEKIISDEARQLAQQDGRSSLDHALSDGEDFELLVAGDKTLQDEGLSCVGHIVDRRENKPVVTLRHADGHEEPLQSRGYEHFQ
jgi:thiamine-monophosphate kinase